MKKRDLYFQYLKQFGIPVMCLSAIVTKGMQIGTYGLEQELELETILIDIIVWTFAAFVLSYGLYRMKTPIKLPDDFNK